jgi:hypothetical protein
LLEVLPALDGIVVPVALLFFAPFFFGGHCISC